jgi:hypothetical protein
MHAGFYHYPAGGVQGDTSMTEDSASQAFFDSSATYDRAVNRWLPVASGAVSPDGLRFAFADYDLSAAPVAGSGALASTGRVHIVDARTGADQVVFSGSPTLPDAGMLVYQTHDPIATLPGRPAFSDTHAAWLGGNSPPSSVWRLASDHMTRVPVPVAGSGWVSVAGPCV